jgi:hypothetical protein
MASAVQSHYSFAMLHSPQPFPDKAAFASWLEADTGLTRGSSKDVTSRLNILRRYVPDAEKKPFDELKLEIRSLAESGQVSKSMGAGMLRALILYKQFQVASSK